jgi:hypothetical protein
MFAVILWISAVAVNADLSSRLRHFEIGRRTLHRITKRGADEAYRIPNSRVEEVIVATDDNTYVFFMDVRRTKCIFTQISSNGVAVNGHCARAHAHRCRG